MHDHVSRMPGDLTRALQSLESDPSTPQEVRRLLQELQRYQLELEAQNRELQRAQQALEESRARYVDLYDFAPMAYLSLDERACIQELNLTSATLLRQDRAALSGLPFTPFVEPADVGRFLLHMRRCLGGETLSTELKLRIGESLLDVRLHSAPFKEGRSLATLCRTAILDITELRQMQVRLSASARMAAVGTIAAGIAHEINNPLAFLMGSLNIAIRALQTEAPAPAEPAPSNAPDMPPMAETALKALDEAQLGAERIQGIVKALGAFAHPTEAKLTRLNVQQVLEQSVKMAMAEIRPRARLVRDYSEVPEVLADTARLGQVFLHLLVNAAQALPEGAAGSNEIRIRVRAVEQTVLVQIQDTGEGIPAHVLDRIFDPFFTTRPTGKGVGLGLAISQNLMSQMGGNIFAESIPGRGSTFSVRIPAAPPLPQPSLLSLRSNTSAPRRGHILIVDDEPKLGNTLRILLEIHHQVSYTPRAREALNWIKEGKSYDAILCDLMMADVTGRQFFEELSLHSPEQARRIIFMTGGAYTPTSQEFVTRMSNPLLTKPFKVEEFEKLLRPLLPPV